jgi:hypothetical protein
MITPEFNAVYVVELCSGEQRRWRYRGVDGRGVGWWQDMETGVEFSDTSLLYVWQLLRKEEPAA